jgi:hypothetical protein
MCLLDSSRAPNGIGVSAPNYWFILKNALRLIKHYFLMFSVCIIKLIIFLIWIKENIIFIQKEIRSNDSPDQNISSNAQSFILFNLKCLTDLIIWRWMRFQFYQIRSKIKNNYQNLIFCAMFKKKKWTINFFLN